MRSERSVPWWSYLYAMTVSTLFLLVVSAPSAQGQTVIATVPLSGGQGFYYMAVNPVTNKIYVANGSNLTVIDGATNSTVTIPGAGGPLAVNSATNKIYVCKGSNLTVIDGATNAITTVTDPNVIGPMGPVGIAVNPVTNKAYVANADANNDITVIDGATDSTTTITDKKAASPWYMVVNPVTSKIYVSNVDSGNVTVIDGAVSLPIATLSTTSLSFPGGVQVVGITGFEGEVILTNTGIATLKITSIATEGDFAQTNDYGSNLAAGTNCVFIVSFRPTATGTRSGSITITDNAPGSPQTISLTGIGVSGRLALTPTSLTFASQAVGTASTIQKVTLTNGTTSDLESGLDYLFPNNADFEGLMSGN